MASAAEKEWHAKVGLDPVTETHPNTSSETILEALQEIRRRQSGL
jgi:hypothetical protein